MQSGDKAISFSLPAIIKARMEGERRIVTVEASNESKDSEGDIILQKALLDSADSFIKTGHLDIDHYSEIGHRIGIANPEWYIVGNPLEAYDGGDGRTFVKGEIRRAPDGSFNPGRPYDMLWEGLTSEPPVKWYASIFGYPIASETEDYSDRGESPEGATRFLVKGIHWTSLAFTRKPVNQALRGNAKIVSAKALIKSILEEQNCWEGGHLYESKKGPNMPMGVGGPEGEAADGHHQPIMNGISVPGELALSHLMAGRDCPKCGYILRAAGSLNDWRKHFSQCAGMPEGLADICSHAAIYKHMLMGYY